MPKRGIAALLITTGALILLLSFKTPDQTVPVRSGGGVAIVEPTTGIGGSATAAPTPTLAPGATAAPTPTATSEPASGGSSAKTVDGPVVSTRYGDIQVEVVVASGKVTDVVALQLPTGRRSGQISSYAEPILHQEAISAQSATIDLVSGATYTSDAYTQSLQAALNQAGL
ncbi:MAG: hypothetical protein QOC97_1674 [Chloroflexota bacterium]|jgi:uncharacterized protein with FMN-binding domain|nr:hypothetical protein [Chloroflexota bacterium]